jgi:hypothetical protein
VLYSYRGKVTVCRGRGAGVSCATLPCGFYPAGNCGARKGGVNELGKLRSDFGFLDFLPQVQVEPLKRGEKPEKVIKKVINF